MHEGQFHFLSNQISDLANRFDALQAAIVRLAKIDERDLGDVPHVPDTHSTTVAPRDADSSPVKD